MASAPQSKPNQSRAPLKAPSSPQSKPNQSSSGNLGGVTSTPKPSTGGGSSRPADSPQSKPNTSTPSPNGATVPQLNQPQQSVNTLAQVDLPQSTRTGLAGPQSINQQAQQAIILSNVNQIESQRNQQILDARNQGAGGVVTLPENERVSTFGRIKRFFTGSEGSKKGDKPVGVTGYNVAGFSSPTPSGRGTIIEGGVTTESEKRIMEFIERAEIPVQTATNRIVKEEQASVLASAELKVSGIVNRIQNRINSGEITKTEGENLLNTEVERINQQANIELQNRIELRAKNDPAYIKAVNERENIANKLGIGTEGKRLTVPELNKEIKQENREQLKNVALTGLSVGSFALGPVAGFGVNAALGLKDLVTAERETIVDISGNRFAVEERLTGAGKIQAALGSAFILGSGAGLVNVAGRSLAQESALNVLNRDLRSGTYKFTDEALQTGKVKVNVAGKEEVIDIGVSQANKLNTQLNRASLERISDIKITSGGGVRETEIYKNIESNPELAKQIREGAELGTIEFNYYGKPTRFNFIRKFINDQDKNLAVTQVFKITKSGNIKRYTLSTSSVDEEGKIISSTFRPARPSELPEQIKIPTTKELPPLEINPTTRFKSIAQTKSIIEIQKEQREAFNEIIRKQTAKTKTLKVGGKGKGTQSIEEIFDFPNANLIYRKTKPEEVIVGESRRVERLGKPRDVTVNQLGTIDEEAISQAIKVGEQRTGLAVEQSRINIIKNPPKLLTYRNVPTPYEIPELKLGNIKQESDNFVNNIKKVIKKEEVLPSYVGGKGGVESASSYQFGGIDFERSLSRAALDNQALLGIEMTSSRPSIKGINKLKEEVNQIYESNIQFDLKSKDLNKPKLEEVNIEKIKLVNPQGLKAVTEVKPFTKIDEGFKTSNIPRQEVQLKAPQIEIPQFEVPKFNVPEINIPPAVIPDFSFGYVPPKSDIGNGPQNFIKELNKQVKNESKYTASYGAAVFQEIPTATTIKELEKLNKQEFTGAEIRPVRVITNKSQGDVYKFAEKNADRQLKEIKKETKRIKSFTKKKVGKIKFDNLSGVKF